MLGNDEKPRIEAFAPQGYSKVRRAAAAILDCELQERGVFSIGCADREAIIRRVVSDTAALAKESLTTPLNVGIIEQERGSR